VFCNADPVVGHEAITAANEGLFETIAGLRHRSTRLIIFPTEATGG
jgi:hypothetical protein